MKNKLILEQLIDKYLDKLYRYANILTYNDDESKDIVHNVFVKYIECVRNGKKFKDEKHERNWLYKVTRNCCINVEKSARNTKTVPLTDDIEITVEYEVENELTMEIKKLNEKYRRVLELYYINGLPTLEIANILNLTDEAVRKRLERGRNIIREKKRKEENLDV